MTFIKVVLPEPEGPMMDSRSPLWTRNDTPRGAEMETPTSPMLQTLAIASISMIGLSSLMLGFSSAPAMAPDLSLLVGRLLRRSEGLSQPVKGADLADSRQVSFPQSLHDLTLLLVAHPRSDIDTHGNSVSCTTST